MSAKKSLKRVLIMAGGTGGHIFPGLALADHLQKNEIDIAWLGTSLGLEAKIVPENQIPLHKINISGVRGKKLKTMLFAPIKIAMSIVASYRIIKKLEPDVVIGMGGFVSGPGGVAAWLAKKPLIIHEQNAIAGKTNKILARFATKVLEAFPQSFGHNAKVITVGNPVRSMIESLPPPKPAGVARKLRLLVIGGSLGAHVFNEMLPQALAQIDDDIKPEIFHQCGQKHLKLTQENYKQAGVLANIEPFIENMSDAYAWADVVLCRAGALTVSELCVAGKGAIFVPYPYAVDDHQTANAAFMVQNNAALLLPQSSLTIERLAETIRALVLQPGKGVEMAKAAYALRKLGVAETIYKICQEVHL